MSQWKSLEYLCKNGNNLRDARDQLRDYVYGLSQKAFNDGDTARNMIGKMDELRKRQADIKSAFLNCIGGLPGEIGETPSSKVVDILKFNGFSIEKVIFESRENVFVTANLYIPSNLTKPAPAIQFLCGHHSEAKHVSEYQIVCRHLVKQGFIVLAQDPPGQGERFSFYEQSIGRETIGWGTNEHDTIGMQCLTIGDGIARYFLHDAMRGIDYLCSRKEVDATRIGVTGNSGGGTQTCIMMLADDRIAAAAPGTFLMSRESYIWSGQAQDSEQVWRGFTQQGYDHEDILIAMVPKPVLILAVEHDFFPLEGTKRTYNRCLRFWEMYGHKDNLEIYVDDSNHKYTNAMASKAADFFAKHLKPEKMVDIDLRPIASNILWCTVSGQIRGELDKAQFIYDENKANVDKCIYKYKSITDSVRKEKTRNYLHECVFKNRKPCDFYIKKTHPAMNVEDLVCDSLIWFSQEGITNHCLLFRQFNYSNVPLEATILLWPGGCNNLRAQKQLIRKICSEGRAALVIDLTGMGMVEQRTINGAELNAFYGTMFKLAADMLWLNDSLCALRVYDLLRCIDMVQECKYIKGDNIEVITKERYSIYAEIAAFLDDRIQKLTSINRFEGYRNFTYDMFYEKEDLATLILPEILKYADLDDICRWL